MDTMLHIGINPRSVQAAKKAILDILKTQSTDTTTVEALKTLHALCAVRNTSINNCTFTHTPTVPRDDT